jgi:large subunit ribosomal protein L10
MRSPAAWKTQRVDRMAKEIQESPVAALVSIKGIRNNQLQKIRRDLRNDLKIEVVRNRLFLKALERVKRDNIGKLAEFSTGQLAVITTKHDPSRLGRILQGTKQKAAARGGETAEDDIVIPEMATNFPPGPMISEFQKAGLQTAIEKGKIVIKKETVYVKKGETIPKDKAKILEKLEILPVTVGLDVVAAYQEGLIFDREALSITLEQIVGNIAKAFAQAKGIALDAMFLVPAIVPDLIVKARLNAEHLALETGYVDSSNVELFILKAIREATTLNNTISGEEAEQAPGHDNEKKKETKDEPKESDEDRASEGLSSLFG